MGKLLIVIAVALVPFACAALLPWRAARLLVTFVPAAILFFVLAGSKFCSGDSCMAGSVGALIGLMVAAGWLAVTGAGLGLRALVRRVRSRGRRDAAAL
jgi:hypothetical protein